MNDLHLYTSEELINEIVRRETFVGVIVRSEKECKFRKEDNVPETMKIHNNFKVTWKNLEIEQVCTLLKDTLNNLPT